MLVAASRGGWLVGSKSSAVCAALTLTRSASTLATRAPATSASPRRCQRRCLHVSAAQEVSLGPRKNFPVRQLSDCNDVLDNRDALLRRFDRDGYLFVRQLHDPAQVLEARLGVLRHLADVGGVLDSAAPLEQGLLAKHHGPMPFMEGRNAITHSGSMLRVLEGPRVKALFRLLFDEEPLTFDYKWLRAVSPGGYTGAHCDSVYMSRGTPALLTCWTPVGDVTTDMGTLAVLEGSHRHPAFKRLQETYGAMDVESINLAGTGWFTTDPEELRAFGADCVWKTADFQAGDVLIFNMHTLHMSTTNESQLARVSCDTRWQPASHQSDPRYVGDSMGHKDAKFGAHADSQAAGDRVKIEQLKAQWGFPVCQPDGTPWLQ